MKDDQRETAHKESVTGAGTGSDPSLSFWRAQQMPEESTRDTTREVECDECQGGNPNICIYIFSHFLSFFVDLSILYSFTQ